MNIISQHTHKNVLVNYLTTSKAPAFGRLLLRGVAQQQVRPGLIQRICTVSCYNYGRV